MLTDVQAAEIAQVKAQYEDGLIAATEASIAIAEIVFPREIVSTSIEAARHTKTWRDFDNSIRPQVDALFAALAKQ